MDGSLARVARLTSSGGSPRSSLELLLRGATSDESVQGLSTALGPDAVLLDGVRVDGSVVTVPLVGGSPGLGRSDEVLAYAQIVATLTALPDVTGVGFVRDGRTLSVPRGDGSLAHGPLTRRDYADLL